MTYSSSLTSSIGFFPAFFGSLSQFKNLYHYRATYRNAISLLHLILCQYYDSFYIGSSITFFSSLKFHRALFSSLDQKYIAMSFSPLENILTVIIYFDGNQALSLTHRSSSPPPMSLSIPA